MKGDLLYAGVDVGSATTKAVIVNADGEALGNGLLPSGNQLPVAAEHALAEALSKAGSARENIHILISTGYGRECVSGEPTT